jgi:hypothetical protein
MNIKEIILGPKVRLNGGRSEDSEDFEVSEPTKVKILKKYPDAYEVEVPGFFFSLFLHRPEKKKK